jgi:hypothetical protein
MFGLRWNENHVPGANRAYPFRSLDRAFAFDDEIEVLTVLVQMKGGRRIAFVVHDAGEHVINVRQFFIDEEYALSAGHDRYQLRQFILMEDVCHLCFSFLNLPGA